MRTINRERYIAAAKRLNQRMVRAEKLGYSDSNVGYKAMQMDLEKLGVKKTGKAYRIPERIATMSDKQLIDFVRLVNDYSDSIRAPKQPMKSRVGETKAQRYRRMAAAVSRQYENAKKQGLTYFPEIKNIEKTLKEYGMTEIPTSFKKAGAGKNKWDRLISRLYRNPLMEPKNMGGGENAEVARRFRKYFSTNGMSVTDEEIAALVQMVLMRQNEWQELLGLYDSGQVITLVTEMVLQKEPIDTIMDIIDQYKEGVASGKIPKDADLDNYIAKEFMKQKMG